MIQDDLQQEDAVLLVGRETERFVFDSDDGGSDRTRRRWDEDPRARLLRALGDVHPSLAADRRGVRTAVDHSYIDCDQYVEACSDLAEDPVASRLLSLASERQTVAAATEVERREGRTLCIIKHPMEYRSGASCGVHINTDHRRPHEQIGPLLDSLILALPVLDGPGGLGWDGQTVRFTLNPKASKIRMHSGVGQVAAIPLRHHRPARELSQNRHRFSFINSYDPFSHSADILARAIQMVMVRVADLGEADDDLARLIFDDPMAVLRRWYVNPFHRMITQSGRRLNSPEMLLDYMNLSRGYMGSLPAWAGVLLDAASDLMELVARDQWEVDTPHLDWPAKRRMLEASAKGHTVDADGPILIERDGEGFDQRFLDLAVLDQVAHDIRLDGVMNRMLRSSQDAYWGFDDALLEKATRFPPVASGRPAFLSAFVTAWSGRSDRGRFCMNWNRIIDDLCGHLDLPNVRGFHGDRLAWTRNTQGGSRRAKWLLSSMESDDSELTPGDHVVIVGPCCGADSGLSLLGKEGRVEEVESDGTVRVVGHSTRQWPRSSLLTVSHRQREAG